MRGIAGHSMSTILEESSDTARIVFPPLPEVVEIPESVATADVAPTEDLGSVFSLDNIAVEPPSPNFYIGSKPNVVYVLVQEFNKDKLNTFYVLIRDHAAVMIWNQSSATLADLRDYLLQQCPNAGLMTPVFSANNDGLEINKSNTC